MSDYSLVGLAHDHFRGMTVRKSLLLASLVTVFVFSPLLPEAGFGRTVKKTKPPLLSAEGGFFLRRGSVIRTHGPLVPNQMR